VFLGILEGDSSTVEEVTEVGIAEGGTEVDGEGGKGGEEGEGKGTFAPPVLLLSERLQEGEMEEEGLTGWREERREGGRGKNVRGKGA